MLQPYGRIRKTLFYYKILLIKRKSQNFVLIKKLIINDYKLNTLIIMAKNTNEGHRVGAVKERSQVLNPKTNQYVKRDTKTGKFIATSDNKFKGVSVEKKVSK